MLITNNKNNVRYLFYKVAGVPKSLKFGPNETIFIDDLDSDSQILKNALDYRISNVFTRFNRNFSTDFTIQPTLGINSCRLTYDSLANAPVADVNSVSQWNTFFNLPTKGSPFTSVRTYNNSVYLLGGSGITVEDNLFGSSDSLIGIDDSLGSIIAVGDSSFQQSGLRNISLMSATTVTTTSFADIASVSYLNMPALLSGGSSSFAGTYVGGDVTFPSLIDIQTSFNGFISSGTLRLPALKFVPTGAFTDCRIPTLYSPNVTGVTTSSFDSSLIGSISLPLVTKLSASTFYNCSVLTSLYIPNVVSVATNCFKSTAITGFSSSLITGTLPANTFDFCVNLVTVDLPNIAAIGNAAFNACISLTGVTFPNAITVGSSVFFGCTSLRSAVLTACTSIQSSSFRNCTSLTDIRLDSCTALGASALNNNIFQGISSQNMILTIKASRMTANGGAPDGDIVALQTANTLTVIQT